MLDNGEQAIWREVAGKARQRGRPVHPVKAGGGDDQRVRPLERRALDGSGDPAEIGALAARQGLTGEDHGCGDVYCINPIHERGYGAGDKARSAARVEQRALPCRLTDQAR
jgi:hypothetical protein